MEWGYEIKIKIWRFCLLRKKDKYMIGANAKRWAFGFLDKHRFCHILVSI